MGEATLDAFRGTDRYEVRRRLGGGGMGIVYEAIDRERNVRVALKTMRVADAAALYRFKREFRDIADIAHPNLVALYELVADAEPPFFTMEHVKGVDFLRFFRPTSPLELAPTASVDTVDTNDANERGKRDRADAPTVDSLPATPSRSERPPSLTTRALGPDELARLAEALGQLARGVHALHAAGKLHRDLKPGNVLVTTDGRVVVLDFGLVTDLQRGLTLQNQIAGTAEYMSPEQAAAAPLTEASDWYSVGVMLYEALTGTLPFSGAPLRILMDKQRFEPVQPRLLVGARAAEDETFVLLEALCLELLARDPTKRPTGREILRRLGAEVGSSGALKTAIPVSVPTVGAALIGRERHLASLDEAYARVRAGNAVSVFAHGSSGMGKSLLVRHFLDGLEEESRAKNTVVLVGRCYERESIPYKALDALVDALTRYLLRLPEREVDSILPRDIHTLTRVFPVLRRVELLSTMAPRRVAAHDPQELRRRAFVALRELLDRLAATRTLIVWIDDLQWGDVDSVAILGELLRPPEPPTMLLLTTYRTENATTSPALLALADVRAQLRDDLDAREIEVGVLTFDESRLLATKLLGGDDAATARHAAAIAAEAGGNPFFVGVLVRHAQSAVALRVSSGGRTVRLNDVLLASFGALLPDEHRLLQVVAVAGHPLSREVAMRAAEIPVERQDAVLGALRAGHFVRTTRIAGFDEMETYHDRIRETLVESLRESDVAGLHKRVAIALMAAGNPQAEALAVHFRAAGDQDIAADWAEAAGDEAAQALAFHRAATWFRAATELGRFEGAHARLLARKEADALANAGRGGEAARAYLAAAARAGPEANLELRRKAAMQLFVAGHVAEATVEIRAVLADVGIAYPVGWWRLLLRIVLLTVYVELRGVAPRGRRSREPPAEALARCDAVLSAAQGFGFVDPLRAFYFGKRALLLALALGERTRLATCLSGEAALRAARGTRGEKSAARLIARVEALIDPLGDPSLGARLLAFRGIVAHLGGRWRQALDLVDRGVERMRHECTGVVWDLNQANVIALMQLFYLGELGELARRVPSLLQDARERGDVFLATAVRIGRANTAWLVGDDPTRARQEVDEAMRSWSDDVMQIQHYDACLARVQIHLYVGDGARALADVQARWSSLARGALFVVQHVRLDALHLRARAAVAAACETDAPTLRARLFDDAARDAHRMGREGAPWASALAILVHAAVAHGRGDTRRALALLDEATRALLACDMALFATAARRRRGELIGGKEGAALVAAADATMATQSIKNPTRMTAMLAPGFVAHESK